MKMLAILEVDEEMLAQTGHTFEEEMGWISQSGISLVVNVKAKESIGFEYAAFAWHKEHERYEQIGRPVMTEMLCRNRFKENVERGLLMDCYDCNRVIYQKRVAAVYQGTWEEIKEDKEDGE